MEPVLTADQVKALDRRAADLGVRALLLMEGAGRGAAAAISRLLPAAAGGEVVAVCGPGGNGGDALCAARWLGLWGGRPWALVLGEPRGAAADQARAFAACFPDRLVRVSAAEELSALASRLGGADLIIDGILGVGVKGAARGLARAAIEWLAAAAAPVVAIDLPSGLAADSGAVPGPAVEAEFTLAMGALKPCHLLPPAAARCGRLEVIQVPYPPAVWEGEEPVGWVLSDHFCARALPARPRFGHKGTFGRVLVVGGAVGMAGAVSLAAAAALRAGAGLVHVLVPEPLYAVVEGAVTEALVHPAPAEAGAFAAQAAAAARTWAEDADVVLLGPGMGRTAGGREVVEALVPSCPKLVVDADALFHLAGSPGLLVGPHGELILTPHPGEFGRLVGKDPAQVVADKIHQARRAARDWGAVVVLKGPPTAVATPGGEVYLNTTGNTALAHGGAGDVLAGLIAGLWAGGAAPHGAACAGVFVHGLAADRLCQGRSQRGVLPGDLPAELPDIFAQLERRQE